MSPQLFAVVSVELVLFKRFEREYKINTARFLPRVHSDISVAPGANSRYYDDDEDDDAENFDGENIGVGERLVREVKRKERERNAAAAASAAGTASATAVQDSNIRLIISNTRHGFIYDVGELPRPIAHYSYNSNSRGVRCSISLLFSLSDHGLEVYPMRWSGSAMNSDTYLPPPFCMARLPFVAVVGLALIHDHLMLLSKYRDTVDAASTPTRRSQNTSATVGTPGAVSAKTSSSTTSSGGSGSSGSNSSLVVEDISSVGLGQSNWNLYVLHLSPAAALYQDIEEKALEYETDLPSRLVSLFIFFMSLCLYVFMSFAFLFACFWK